MRITEVRTAVVGTAWRNLTLVEVHTDEGLTGVGESRMVNHTDALLGYLSHAVPTHVIGSDPFDVESLVGRMYRRDYERAGPTAMSAIAVIEMACWDIVGKALGQPVYRLLGGSVRDRIPAYANGWYQVERTPDDFHAAARAVVERRYRALKVDPFGPGVAELSRAELVRSIALVEAIRDAVGPDVEVFVEMHGRFAPAFALRVARALEPYEPGWIEEPVPPENLRALAKVAARSPIPVATGERLHTRYDFRELFELQAADVIQPDVGNVGGILETRKLAATAEVGYVLVAPHNVGGPVLTAANLHVAACTPNFKVLEYFNDFADAAVKRVAPGVPEIGDDGAFPLPGGPGLGVTLDWDAVAELPRRAVTLDLFAEDWQLRGSETG